jgi:hypothetical protein
VRTTLFQQKTPVWANLGFFFQIDKKIIVSDILFSGKAGYIFIKTKIGDGVHRC